MPSISNPAESKIQRWKAQTQSQHFKERRCAKKQGEDQECKSQPSSAQPHVLE